jgi:hypothetical protein
MRVSQSALRSACSATPQPRRVPAGLLLPCASDCGIERSWLLPIRIHAGPYRWSFCLLFVSRRLPARAARAVKESSMPEGSGNRRVARAAGRGISTTESDAAEVGAAVAGILAAIVGDPIRIQRHRSIQSDGPAAQDLRSRIQDDALIGKNVSRGHRAGTQSRRAADIENQAKAHFRPTCFGVYRGNYEDWPDVAHGLHLPVFNVLLPAQAMPFLAAGKFIVRSEA